MAYTVVDSAERKITWSTNPSGLQATATILAGDVVEFTILDANGMQTINSLDQGMLEFIRQAIVDLQAEILAL